VLDDAMNTCCPVRDADAGADTGKNISVFRSPALVQGKGMLSGMLLEGEMQKKYPSKSETK